jgi:hypothetical protein
VDYSMEEGYLGGAIYYRWYDLEGATDRDKRYIF